MRGSVFRAEIVPQHNRRKTVEKSMFKGAPFKKATACNLDPVCVEVAISGDEVAVRDSKNPTSPHQVFSKAEWSAFISGVKAGEFDV